MCCCVSVVLIYTLLYNTVRGMPAMWETVRSRLFGVLADGGPYSFKYTLYQGDRFVAW